jgi:tetratricopeptide (TPR) repeat protein
VALVALVVRLAHLWQARSVPLFSQLISDARAYFEWAQTIAAGDWPSRAQGVFYQAPLYPYLLAVLLRLGGGLWAIRLLQAALGAVACSLLCDAGTRLFGGAAGLVAGLCLALYAPAVFADGLIQKESLGMLLMVVVLHAAVRLQPQPRRRLWVGLGVALGALSLVRENLLLLAPLFLGWLLARFRDHGRADRARWALCLAAGLGVVLAPVALRNLWVGGSLALTTAQAGPNFYIGNHAGATGSYVPLRAGRSDTAIERGDAVELAERALGRPLSAGEVSRYWLGRGVSFIQAQPLAWLALLGRKTWMFFHAYEVPDVEDMQLYARSCSLLRALGALDHFGVLAPLGLLGIVLTWPRRRDTGVLIACLLVSALGVIAFYVLGRYRFPVVPILALFAGAAVTTAASQLRSGSWRRLRGPALVAAAAAVLVNLPGVPWIAPGGMSEVNLGVALAAEGRLEEAMQRYRAALRLEPNLSEAHLNLGNVLLVQGRTAEALPHLRAAVRLAPDDAPARVQLGAALRLQGQLTQAERELRAALASSPSLPAASQELSALLLSTGRADEAAAVLEAGLRRAPSDRGLALRLAGTLLLSPGRSVEQTSRAVRLAEAACPRERCRDLLGLRVLAAAYQAAGRNADLEQTLRAAIRLAEARGDKLLAGQLRAGLPPAP